MTGLFIAYIWLVLTIVAFLACYFINCCFFLIKQLRHDCFALYFLLFCYTFKFIALFPSSSGSEAIYNHLCIWVEGALFILIPYINRSYQMRSIKIMKYTIFTLPLFIIRNSSSLMQLSNRISF